MYDFLIVGGGPAGLSAAIYAARFHLKTIVITKQVGGTIVNAHLIENWPGVKSSSGLDLMEKFREHVEHLGVEIKQDDIVEIKRGGKNFLAKTRSGGALEARSILLATGSEHRKLDIPGENEFQGKGVSYCATCDAAFFKGKTVAVVGGSDSAVKESILLSEYAKQVYVIYRGDRLRAEPINISRMDKKKNIEIVSNTNVVEIKGDKFVTGAVLDKPYEGSKDFRLDGLFVEVGYMPGSNLARDMGVVVNERKEIIVDNRCKTNVEGVFAAGDVTNTGFKQVVTAAADGVKAAFSAYKYLGGLDLESK
ncbi:MAG: FAD-dependent oxidoreductase [Candidatus Altiarchaeota archaeon]|nr:FAD-dependent oxidoreductase [Candidatus Altiarchaeota archaeon]